METAMTVNYPELDKWVKLTDLARELNCSYEAMHKWGKAGNFGYRQIGPRRFDVKLSEVVRFYESRFPNIVLNHNSLKHLIQHI